MGKASSALKLLRNDPQELARRASSRLIAFARVFYRKITDVPYEIRLGISTSKLTNQHADTEEQIHGYQPVPYVTLRKIARHIDRHARDVRCFVDVGCGLGRPLHFFASRFDELIGYELAENLFRSGVMQLLKARRHRPPLHKVALLKADATAVIPVDRDLVVFLYNPFGPKLMLKLCEHLQKSRSAIHIYYAYPKYADVIEDVFKCKPERITGSMEVAYFFIASQPDAARN